MRLTLHMGTHKTGTTTIQDTLDRARDLLRGQGVLYPRAGRKHRGKAYQRHRGVSQAPDGSERQAKVFARLFEEIDNAGCDHVILSCETWCRDTAHPGLLRLLEQARARGLEPEGVLYLRNRYAYARSHYREWTQNWHNKHPFARYLEGEPDRWDYTALAQKMNAALDGAVRYYCFDEVPDVMEHFEIEMGLPQVPRIGTRNPSLSAFKAEVQRQANARAPKDADFAVRALAACADLAPEFSEHGEPLDQPLLHMDKAAQTTLRKATGLTVAEVSALCALPAQKPDIAAARDPVAARLANLTRTA